MGRKFSLQTLWQRKDRDEQRASRRPCTMEDAFKISLLLRTLPLPPDVIPDILDFAGVFVYVTATTNTQGQVVNERSAGIVHSVTPIPPNIHRLSVRSVVFTTVSHDQGWSWDKASHGTYGGSWTWFEAGMLMPQVKNPTLQDCRKIITNVHACKDDRRHRVEWFYDDPDPYIQLIFRRLRAGDSIGINVCALYPGWQNLVKESSIGFTFQPVRRMP